MNAPLFPIFADLSNRPVLVVGGGAVAERKVHALLEAGALPVVGSPDLVDGLQAANVSRLFLVGEFSVLDEPELDDRLQRHAAEEIREALQSSPLQWTLVNAPHGVAGLTIEHFSQVGGNLEPGLAEPLERLNRVAEGIADELRLNLHVGQHVNFVAADGISDQ